MSKIFVPPAPTAAWENATERKPDILGQTLVSSSSASARLAPWDAAFLCRLYRSIGWFGIVMALLAYSATARLSVAVSFASGVGLGALLLKSQEIFVRRALRPKNSPKYKGKYKGWDRLIPVWVMLPVKYVLVTLLLGWGIRNGIVAPIVMSFGFIAVQLVIAAKAIGYVLARRVRSVREVYID